MNTYQVPENLLQAIVNILNNLPAFQVRAILNQVEDLCKSQQSEGQV